MSTQERRNPYAVSLTALEHSAHVPRDQQVEEVPEPPALDPVCEERVVLEQMLRNAAG